MTTANSLRFSIGVDGGGSGCRVAVTDSASGRVALASGGPANVASDFEGAIMSVKTAIAEAKSDFDGAFDDALTAAHIGLAGAYTPAIRTRVDAAFSFARQLVTDDRAGAMEGALDGQNGYLVMAGTGMIVGRLRGEQQRFVGGHGLHLSDHGSGAWIGRLALDIALRAHENLRPPSDLTRELLAEFNNDAAQIVEFSLAARPSDYAKLAPAVIAAAQSRDPHGEAILRAGADYIEIALRALEFERGDGLCFAGGVGPFYKDWLSDDFLSNIVPPAGNALDGAIRIAERLRTTA